MKRGRASRRARLRKRLNVTQGLRLTSMMDILTVLLLFLLKSFVVDGEAIVPPPGVELPASTSTGAPENSLTIAIDNDAILFGNERVSSVSEAVAGSDLMIAPLAARLDAARTQMDAIAGMQGAASAPRVVTIQGDREIEFRVLQRVMYTVNHSGFEHVALAVMKREQGV